MNAKEFLAEKGIFNLDTKKRYNEVIAWMEEYVALHQPFVSGSVADAVGRNCPFCGETCVECSHKAIDCLNTKPQSLD